jgi:hypothetical protein
MTKRDETLGHTSIMTHAQIVRRAKAIVQAALDERDKAIAEAQGMLCVVSAVMVKNGGEIIVTQDDLDNAPRNLAFETDAEGNRRIVAFEMRAVESDEQKQIAPPPEQKLLTTGEVPAVTGAVHNHGYDPTCAEVMLDGRLVGACMVPGPVSRTTTSGSKIELL